MQLHKFLKFGSFVKLLDLQMSNTIFTVNQNLLHTFPKGHYSSFQACHSQPQMFVDTITVTTNDLIG